MKFINLPKEAEGHEDLLREIVALRVRANEKLKESTEAVEQANELFEGLVKLAGFDAVETDLGTIRLVKKTNPGRLDKDKLKDALVKAGVDSDTVVDSFKKATGKPIEARYIAFFPPKGE